MNIVAVSAERNAQTEYQPPLITVPGVEDLHGPILYYTNQNQDSTLFKCPKHVQKKVLDRVKSALLKQSSANAGKSNLDCWENGLLTYKRDFTEISSLPEL